jgi:hypothetical protein
MLQLVNDTAFPAERAVQIDPQGNQIWVVVVKATFTLDGSPHPSVDPMQEPVCKAPLYFGQPGSSSLLRDCELVADHPGTSICCLGSAWAPDGHSVRVMDARMQVGHLSKTVRVFGDRYWLASGGMLAPSAPEEFRSVPLRYELAYGGTHPDSFPWNPIGRGFARESANLVHQRLPNLEYPTDSTVPAGFGPIPPNWLPRRQFAGTFDSRWREERMPVWPEDFDSRFFLAAPLDQVSSAPLRGGEPVVLENLSSSGTLRFFLPKKHFAFYTETASGRFSQRGQLDRVLIEPDAAKLVMVWRTALNCGPDARVVRKTIIDTKRVLR